MAKQGKNNQTGRSGNRARSQKTMSGQVVKTTVPRGVGNSIGSSFSMGERKVTPIRDGIRVRFTDQLDYVYSPSGTATYKGYQQIGGNFSTFPWLKNLAMSFSRFRVNSITAYISSNVETTLPGAVTIAFLPETTDVINWYLVAENTAIYQFSKVQQGPVWSGTGNSPDNPLRISLKTREIHNMTRWLYTGTGTATSDINTHYAGALAFQCIGNGGGTTRAVGSLFIEYDMEFVQPTATLFNGYMASGSTTDDRPPEGDGHIVLTPGPPMPSMPKPFDHSEALTVSPI